jgi:hypothetical protein
MRERHRYQVRFKASEAIYHRLLRESAASGTSLSEVVRAAVIEAFAARDAIAEVLTMAPSDGERPARGPLPLLELEQRLCERLNAKDDASTAQAAQLRQIEAMIDRLYYGLMLHVDEVPAHIRVARQASAEARHRAWADAVAEQIEKSRKR